MDKKQVLTLVATIITTLAETNGAPESTLYMFVGMDMDKWQVIRNILIDCKFVTISGHYVKLTEQGRATADKLNASLSKV
jgi:helix-turn-helix protein